MAEPVAVDAISHDDWIADPLDILDATVAHLGGEARAGQRELTLAVVDAIRSGHHLLAEAPTGSGKSLAYLAPVIASGLRVIVATSTIALQNQLIDKDLPTLADASPVPFTFGLLKGRANYVCRAKLRAAAVPDALFEQPVTARFSKHLATLERFTTGSATGDRAQLCAPIPNSSWAAVSCTSTECPGAPECADGEACFAEHAKAVAREVSILVVNHALYCAHLSAGNTVLPDHDVLVLDEAHAFADNATNAFAADLNAEGLARMSRMLAKAGVDQDRADAFARAANALGMIVDQRDGNLDVAADERLVDGLTAAAESLAAASATIDRERGDHAKRVARLVHNRLTVLRRLAAPADDDVVWAEGRRQRSDRSGTGPGLDPHDHVGRSVRSGRQLRVAPIAAGPVVGRLLLDARPVIAVSATLGGPAPFVQLATQIGFEPGGAPGAWSGGDDRTRTSGAGRGYVALATTSSFDWKAQGMLYVARDLPEPRPGNTWAERAGARVCDLVDAAGGRALVLCTSHANVTRFSELLQKRTTHTILTQGDTDVGRLTRTFVDDETSVLVGTRSFWAGIDAPGVACVLVVIDKLPFPAPDEPLHAARRTRAEEAGANAFATVDIPAAALVLAQGAGRLLRRGTDRGVVAVLDPRLATREYRRPFLAALPPFRRSISLEEACAFLADCRQSASIAATEA
jgi:ATP-dependent DNA helicase DinG